MEIQIPHLPAHTRRMAKTTINGFLQELDGARRQLLRAARLASAGAGAGKGKGKGKGRAVYTGGVPPLERDAWLLGDRAPDSGCASMDVDGAHERQWARMLLLQQRALDGGAAARLLGTGEYDITADGDGDREEEEEEEEGTAMVDLDRRGVLHRTRLRRACNSNARQRWLHRVYALYRRCMDAAGVRTGLVDARREGLAGGSGGWLRRWWCSGRHRVGALVVAAIVLLLIAGMLISKFR